ncbi:serine/threonine-protein kinase [Coleofasciculus sp. FACHB-1120]|uniref:serine/threonine-protein kinase n=1 Tax=Coleofasciculus sp. FACHB-1120 TaxID=2692783 RepID=UPI001689194A|nr:serine/threonine-protein kinase [Coleofasciculus sp. FACHB-1120]MBD2744388.1 serine/threonine protein kinase [Coleofasciculus sp. FACHB-1120]
MIGKLIKGRYQIVQLLMSGVFGQTYIAEDIDQVGNPKYVVKHFSHASSEPNSLESARRRFRSETEILTKLGKYTRIPHLLEFFEENQEFYLVQEFIQGHPLSAELPMSQGCVKRWTETEVVEMLQQVLHILAFVHSHGIIHGDLNPNNLVRRAEDSQLFLVDFGAAQSQHSIPDLTQPDLAQPDLAQSKTTLAVGGLGYIPSEQLIGHPRRNSDIYALGAIAIQALTGVEPAQLKEDPETGELIWQHLFISRPSMRVLSDRLVPVLNKMVRYHFKSRYQSASEVLQALQSLDGSQKPVVKTTNQPPVQKAVVHRHKKEPQKATIKEISPQNSSKTEGNTRSYKPQHSPILTGLGIGIAANSLVITGGLYSLLNAFPSESSSDILVTAQDKYQKGDFQSAIALAKSIPEKSPIYPEAQATAREWSQEWHTAAAQFQAAEQAFKESRWLDVLEAARKMPKIAYWQKKIEPLVQKTQPKMEEESQKLLKKAYERAAEKDFTSALNYLKLIPQETPAGAKIQPKIAEYTKKQHIKADYLLQQAYERAFVTDFAGALNYLQQIPQDTPTYTRALAKSTEYAEKQYLQAEAEKKAEAEKAAQSAAQIAVERPDIFRSRETGARYRDINPGSRLQEVTLRLIPRRGN